MFNVPPEGVPYEQWLLDQVAMRMYLGLRFRCDHSMSAREDAHTAWCDAREWMEHRRLIDQGVNKAG